MNDHNCIQEGKLGGLESSVERMDKVLFNGEGGLIRAVPVLCEKVEELTKSTDKLKISIDKLDNYTNQDKGGWSFVKSIAPWIAIVITILIFFMTNQNKIETLDENQQSINNRLKWKQDKPISTQERGIIVKKDSLQY